MGSGWRCGAGWGSGFCGCGWRYLRADAGGDAGELGVGGEGRQVVHSFDERSGGGAAAVPVLLVEGSIQGLQEGQGTGDRGQGEGWTCASSGAVEGDRP